MKVQQDVMNNFLSLLNTSFAIPVYQRNYAWEEQNCAKLLEDIVEISKDISKTHFMGTITFIIHLVPEENGLGQRQEYVIIDGQQRITTIMLLLKALCTKTNDERIKCAIARAISDDEMTMRLRLKPIKRDREAFQCVMENRWQQYSGDSRVKKNYHFFIKKLDEYIKDGYKVEEIYNAFLRLKVVGIGLEKDDDDPQVVFESINATGVRLEGVDLIRNFLMMGESSKEQERLYEKYWSPIEEYLTKEKTIDEFIEAYLRIYDDVNVKKNEVYQIFKAHSKKRFSNNLEGLMQDMQSYARIYQVFIRDDFNFGNLNASDRERAEIKSKIKRIVELKFGVSYPFIMRLAKDFEEDRLSFANFNSMLELLISYYVRRQICSIETNALNKVMYVLYKELERNGEISESGLAYCLGAKSGRERFPNNDLLKKHFVECEAYSLKSSCKFILLEIERLSNVEPPEENKLTIEHFYPQNPGEKSKWRAMTDDWEMLENIWLHTFGNLSLTGQNLVLGNRPFEEKLDLILENGSLHLNEYFTNKEYWGISEIKERGEYLAEKFCEVRVFRDLPKECRQRASNITLDSDLTHHILSEIKFPNGTEAHISNGKSLTKEVIEYLYKHHRDEFECFTDEKNPSCIVWDKARVESKNKQGSIAHYFEKGGFHFVSNASLKDISKNLKKLIEGCKLNPKDFILT